MATVSCGRRIHPGADSPATMRSVKYGSTRLYYLGVVWNALIAPATLCSSLGQLWAKAA